MNVWLTLLAMGFVTFIVRFSVIGVLGDAEMPGLVKRALRFVPVAALTGIIFPALLITGEALNIAPDNFRLVAGLVAIIVAWRTKSILLTISVGMVSLWILQFFFA